MTDHDLVHLMKGDVVLDSLPGSVIASLEIRDRWFSTLPKGSNGEEFVLDELQKWAPGQTVRVAFHGGDPALHQAIADVVREISDVCNIKLDFGRREDGTFRRWGPHDKEYAAEIRVGFDMSGYFSLVGNDSADPNVGSPRSAVGGRPGQCSLNLGGFHIKKPPTWRGTVLHEFLHALSFKHEHTNLSGPCQSDFRWEDDPGYQPTLDSRGTYVKDADGRQPGIYTYLAGYPNHWPKSQVDHNLRPSGGPVTSGSFDRASVMLYRFDPLFYRTPNSQCAPSGDGQKLSAGDIEGLKLLYPLPGPELAAFVDRRQDLIETLAGSRAAAGADAHVESAAAASTSPLSAAAVGRLRKSMAHLA